MLGRVCDKSTCGLCWWSLGRWLMVLTVAVGMMSGHAVARGWAG